MIPAKILTSILLLLVTFIHAFPLELVDHDSSIQKTNLVIRQITPPDSVTATGPESLNLTGLVNTFEVLTEDFNGVEEILRNLTETVTTALTIKTSMTVVQFLSRDLSVFKKLVETLTGNIDGLITLPNGPLAELSNAVPESLMGLTGALDDLENALSALPGGNLNSIRSVFKALNETLNALIAVLVATSKFLVAAENVASAPEGEIDEVLNNTMRLLDGFNGLKGVLTVLELL